MADKILKLTLRLLWLPVSAFLIYKISVEILRTFFTLVDHFFEGTFDIYHLYETIASVSALLLIGFVLIYAILEITTSVNTRKIAPRILTHFRWGPAMVIFFSSIFLISFDLGMIEYSRFEIRRYLFDGGTSLAEPSLRLHNDYRHWCGNGASAHENYLYFETAASGRNDPDPYVRSRSLLIAADVQDWINGGDARFADQLRSACGDPHPIVRSTANVYLARGKTSCLTKFNNYR